MASRAPARAVGCLVMGIVVLAALGVGAFLWRQQGDLGTPLLAQQRCVADAADATVTIDLEQAHFSSIIVGLSIKRGMAPRAASIAMATVYQETDIRNLDYGDRDSVGLFQQRPSQGWGTVEQLMDPYYATNKFYDALVKINNWETDDINDVAQKVQRSGYPEAYRDHETDARSLASVLTGESAAGFSCLDKTDAEGDAAGLARSLKRTFGSVAVRRSGTMITINPGSSRLGWAYAHYAVANSSYFGVTDVQISGQRWRTSTETLPEWSAATPASDTGSVEITLR